jgi:predicted AlkP superfamily pyrophosphatase or phosphodiesterase
LAVLTEVEASITDIAPTAANALGIPDPAIATGQPLTETAADHVLLIFLDAFGYVRYTESLEDGLIPNMATLAPPLLSLTTYPPVTSVSSASLLTGTSPDVHGVDQRGIRKTEMETIFDVAANNGLDVVAVEGDALSFQVRSADFTLSGDRDGNGRTDDNVLANALAVLDEGMPDLFFVHFHGIDDAGHAYGPVTPEEETVIQFVDDAVGQILDALPPNTLVIIFADHGMHTVDEDGRHGNHGHLIERDMLIPIFIVEPE